MNIYDGHIHTPFCPHGTNDTFEQYVERAIELGYTEMTFTEHAPLPEKFTDPVPTMDSAMQRKDLARYFQSITKLKEKYHHVIKINAGLELDYIEGFEEETKQFLNEWGNLLDDSILSVHFLRLPNNQYVCLDYSPDCFKYIIEKLGSTSEVYKLYYDTLKKSIVSDLGLYKPKRIGHITLIRKFQKKFPRSMDDSTLIEEILAEMKNERLSLDVNCAGLFKPDCKETYPPESWIEKAKIFGIPLVYGSDAHHSKGLGQGLEKIKSVLL
ncbi:histidinol-phosphatase HisJ [Evansella halocellulosilytica]|uniref:histidinol-phosphatase HisJ n=1 Tax=Evansella halocellulosilytica TaxID=2011013 RepID=UPI000BB8A2FF|nr:histidinol-phosphatase HisJ [Evansella halocellulosilytica]